MRMHADSRFTSVGDSSCPRIEVFGDLSVKNCKFENAITTQGPPYICFKWFSAVRMEGNTFDATTKMFEFDDDGTLSAPNYLLEAHNRCIFQSSNRVSPAQQYTHRQMCAFI
jgi:hypothetical protein